MNKEKETKLLTNLFLILEALILIASIVLTLIKNTNYLSSLLIAGSVISLFYSFIVTTKFNKEKGFIIASILCGAIFTLLNTLLNTYQDISSSIMFLSLVCLIPFIYNHSRNFKKGITALIILVVVGSISLVFTKSFNLTSFFMFASIAVAILLFVTALLEKASKINLVATLLLLILNAFNYLNSVNVKTLYTLFVVIGLIAGYALLALNNKESYEK